MAQLECTKIYCNSRKAAILRCLSYPELHGISNTDPFFANDHLLPLGVVTSDRLKESVAGRVTGQRRSPSIPQGGRTSHISSRFIRPPNVVLAHSYSPACTSTTPSIASILAHLPHREFTYSTCIYVPHAVRCPTRAVLQGAILGAQFVLRADMLRAFARLGTDSRDSERRERGEPREDLRLDRAMGVRT